MNLSQTEMEVLKAFIGNSDGYIIDHILSKTMNEDELTDANKTLLLLYNKIIRELDEYTPSCKYGYADCINDDEYIKANNPEWYAELKKMNGIRCCDVCKDGSEYDDEDK